MVKLYQCQKLSLFDENKRKKYSRYVYIHLFEVPRKEIVFVECLYSFFLHLVLQFLRKKTFSNNASFNKNIFALKNLSLLMSVCHYSDCFLPAII